MDNKELNEIIIILKSITLQNQTTNIFDSKMVNGLKYDNNVISFTLELKHEHLNQSESIKRFIEEKIISSG